jgi:DNA-binding NarL/FixJ family response regulator
VKKKNARVVLVVASEDRLFRECLGHRLSQERGFEVGALADAQSVLARTAELHPRVLVLDLDALGATPESLLQKIRRTYAGTPILAMATPGGEHAVSRLLRAGVAGFVAKSEPVATLVRALEAVASGETWAPRRATARALSGLEPERRGAGTRLTPREAELLALLSGGYRNKELASMLGIKEQTVKMHLYRVYQKLQVKSRMEAVLSGSASGSLEPQANPRETLGTTAPSRPR